MNNLCLSRGSLFPVTGLDFAFGRRLDFVNSPESTFALLCERQDFVQQINFMQA